MQNIDYYSMMGLLKKSSLKGIYHGGAWHNFGDLGKVMKDMERCESGDEDKHSIPDVYGRPFQLKISMESMMVKSELDQCYHLTREIMAWRGILTIIALQDFLELKMKVDVVNYQDKENAFDIALKYPPNSNVFNSDRSWNGRIFHIVTLKGDEDNGYSDIAMFSPMTVIYPVADLKMPKVEKLKWFDYQEEKFINPAEVLSPTEKLIVCHWIQYLKGVLKQDGDENGAGIIKYHLDAYEDELKSKLKGKELTPKNCFETVEYDKEFGNINKYVVVNKVLNHTVKVWVWLDSQNKIEYKELFADQFYYTNKEENPFVGCSHSSSHMVEGTKDWYGLIPLGRKIQEQCDRSTIDTLVRNFRMKAISSMPGEIRAVKAELHLSEISGNNVDAEKIYDIHTDGDIVQEKRDFPVIALWPKMNLPEWNQYYIYVAGGKNGIISPNMKGLAAGSNRYVTMTEQYPNAISLKSSKEGKEIDIGMIFPEYSEHEHSQRQSANIAAVVGIDFGTSGTTVYARTCTDNITRQITIQKNVAKLLTSANTADMAMMNQYFLMWDKDKHGDDRDDMRSLTQEKLYSIYLRSVDEPLENVEPILDGIIYQASENEMTEDSKRFMPNIKWENPNNGTYYKAFMEELCLHIWEELRSYNVTTIEWRYALPISLEDSETFHKMWRSGIQAFLKKNISIGHSVTEQNYTESEATSRYFLTSNELKVVNPDKGYMIVDIGGGSTDIAVWQRQALKISMVAQTSVPVAGRLLFTRWVELSINQIKEHVFSKESVVREQLEQLEKYKGDINIINAILERIVTHNNDKIMISYKQNTEWAVRLKKQLEFGVALLFFSLGSMVGHLYKKGLLIDQGVGNFGIALGGNGSKILDWLKMKSDYPELLAMFQEGICSRQRSDYSCNPQIIRSKAPKEEVAQGLVQNGWKDICFLEADIEEYITDEFAIEWNKAFTNKYNELFHWEIPVEEDNIRNLMANVERRTDVCNFFMDYMYCKYYKNKLGELK